MLPPAGLIIAATANLGAPAAAIGPDTSVVTAWAGDVTSTTFTAAHTTAADTSGTRLVASTDPTFATGNLYSPRADTASKTVQHTITGLTADTLYYFCIEVNGTLKTTKSGSFTTMPAAAGVAQNFKFAVIGDLSGNTQGKILAHLAAQDLNFSIFNGDLFYNDIPVDDVAQFDAAYDAAVTGTYAEPFLRNVPTYYMFDNHDGGGTTYDSTSASRPASLSTFRRRAPNPAGAFTGALEPACFAFTQGRVRFIVTDLHTQSDSTTLLGAAQKAWFQAQLATAAADIALGTIGLVFWVHTMTWNSQTWTLGWNSGTRPLERAELATNFIDNALGGRGLNLSGDGHGIMIDNGTNTDYSVGGGLRMPSVCITPLYGTSVLIGEPYSEARQFTKTSQGGIVEITDDGTTITAVTTAYGQDIADASPTTLATYSVSFPIARPALPTGVTLVQEYFKRFGSDNNGVSASYSSTLRQQPAQGNLLILSVAMTGTNTGALATPSGWTKLSTDQSNAVMTTAIFYKIAGASESQTVTWASSGARNCTASILEISGHDGIGQDVVQIETTNVNTVSASVTPSTANEWALLFVAVHNGANMNGARSWSTGFVERHHFPMNLPGSSVGSKQLSTAGVVHTASLTFTGTADEMIARVITIKPFVADTTPDAFAFTDVTGAALSAQQTSNTITVAGINSPAVVTITGGTYSKNGGAYTSSAGTAASGDTFAVRHTSSASYSTATDTVLTIGGVSDTFTSTTAALDTTPDAFTFTDAAGVALSSTQTSDTITVAGLGSGQSAAVAVTGGTYSKNGEGYTSSAGTAVNGDTFAVRHTSSASNSTATNTVLDIGGVSDTFTSTTISAGTTARLWEDGTTRTLEDGSTRRQET